MLRSLPAGTGDLARATWIDSLDATDEERSQIERAIQLHVPAFKEVAEIESSSRVFTKQGALYLSMPLPVVGEAPVPASAVGFVLGPSVLLSVRFSAHPVFDAVFDQCHPEPALDARDIFLRLLEALVDRAADSLEHASAKLDALSIEAFHADDEIRRSPRGASRLLRGALSKLGGTGGRLSQIRDALLGMKRIVSFVSESPERTGTPEHAARFNTIRNDIVSLADYEAQLSGKVQFLLDATLGYINIEQNEIVKTLTVASVVGIPPVLIAGIYGMNFHNMPELSWSFGYPLAIAVIVASALLPLLWFKRRGWM